MGNPELASSPNCPGCTEEVLPPEAAFEPPLHALCGDCHGSEAVANGSVQGGFDEVENFDRLVADGWVIPLDSTDSPLVQLITSGRMPPVGGQPPPSKSDIALLVQQLSWYIDNPRFWPDATVPSADAASASSIDVGLDAGAERLDAGAGR